MHVISRKALRNAGERFPEARAGLDHWFNVARRAEWRSLRDVRRDFPHADPVRVASGNVATVFSVAGNKYRLVAVVHYNRGKVYVAMVLTHADYSRNAWKGHL